MSAGQEGRAASRALHRAVCAGDVRAVQLLAAHRRKLLNRRVGFKSCTGAVTPLELAVVELVGGGWRAGTRGGWIVSALWNASCRELLWMLLADRGNE